MLSRFPVALPLLVVLAISACSAPPAQSSIAATTAAPQVILYPTENATQPPAQQPTETSFDAQYDGAWKPAMRGIDFMLTQATVNVREEWVLMARIDPAQVNMRVHYDPSQPKTAREWQTQTQAGVIINGGFFNEKNQVTGLIVADGESAGKSYRGFGGMFSVGQDGAPVLQWLRDAPYRADDNIAQAVQGFPMLVVNGERIEPMDDNGERNRRSFVAIDDQGRVLLGVTQMAQWSLTDLADYLASTESLGVVSALNLDGGASSGLWMAGPFDGVSMNSFDPVPAVIAVTSR